MSNTAVQGNPSVSIHDVTRASERIRPLAICLTIDEYRHWQLLKRKLHRLDDGAAFRQLLNHSLVQQLIATLETGEASGD